jgi:hypothetical protein
MPKAKQAELTPELNAKIQEWQRLDAQLDQVKQAEMALRCEIVMALCDTAKLEGTETLELGNGWKIKAVKKQNYNLTNEFGETEKLLAAVGQINPAIATGLVKWKPDMSLSTYKKELVPLAATTPELATLLAHALIIKPGSPSLEIVPPKAADPAVA